MALSFVEGESPYSMLSFCLKAMRSGDPRLDEWDETFLYNLETQVEHTYFSPKQVSILKAIWESLQV